MTRGKQLADAPALATAAIGADVVVSGVTLDSRTVRPGDLYAALPGVTTHGARFVDQAVQAGAAAVLTDPEGAGIAGTVTVPVVVVPDPRGTLGELSAWVYDRPGDDLTVIGITGTNGKTTMTYLVSAAMEAGGHRTGIIGTTGVKVGDTWSPSARTTPESPDVHRLLAVMREEGVTAVVMEISSHALALGRVDGLATDVAVFTNLSQDHLDFHASMADYFAAKASLFTAARSRSAVICVDDEWGRTLSSRASVPVTTYGLTGEPDWVLTDVTTAAVGEWTATATGPAGERVEVASVLPGQFNRANVLGALVAAVAAGVPPDVAAAGLTRCSGVPGRMEPVPGAGFGAFVDYAHTPDAVERAVSAARQFTPGRVLVAIGCGGDRDAAKRPLMGRVAALTADTVVVTDDNPRSEDPAMIRQTVLDGARRAASDAVIIEIADRRRAIRHLVSDAGEGDTILILGKGHEQGQEAGGVVTPFDDRIELAEAIRERGDAR